MRSLNTINTACLTLLFDDPISLTEQILAVHSVCRLYRFVAV